MNERKSYKEPKIADGSQKMLTERTQGPARAMTSSAVALLIGVYMILDMGNDGIRRVIYSLIDTADFFSIFNDMILVVYQM
jgi:hypothetical protein